ncbi:MAG TPA: hypothetical protein VFL04_03970, partial [Rectinemataceae bacterium]|nr:hypothetical protein [Rectinemataceae bacterium]
MGISATLRFRARSGAAALGLVLLLGLAPLGAQAPAPKLFIGLFKENVVAVLDTASNRIVDRIPIPAGPHGLAITPDGTTLFASSDGDSKVSVIDTATDKVTQTIEVGNSPHGLAMAPDGRLLLAAVFGASSVVFIDTATKQVVGRVAVPSPHNIAISPDGRTAYVAAQAKGSLGLAILDLPSMAQRGFFPLDKTPRALSFSPDGRKLYYTLAGSDSVQDLATADNVLEAQVPVGASPHLPLFSADGKSALVVSQGPGELYIIDTARGQVSGKVKVGAMPHWIALSADGRTAYVTNEGSGDLCLVDLASRSLVATIPLGQAPRKLVIQPSGGARVSISGFSFPDRVSVAPGGTVTWTNRDAVTHTVTADDRSWDSGELAQGQSYSVVFRTPGSYAYHC